LKWVIDRVVVIVIEVHSFPEVASSVFFVLGVLYELE